MQVKLPVKISYRISRLVNKLEPIISTYDKNRIKLIEEFGEKNEKGAMEIKDPKKVKLFMVEIEKLLALEEEIEFEPIKIGDIGDAAIEPKNITSFIFSE